MIFAALPVSGGGSFRSSGAAVQKSRLGSQMIEAAELDATVLPIVLTGFTLLWVQLQRKKSVNSPYAPAVACRDKRKPPG